MKDMSAFNGISGPTLEDLDFIQEVIKTDLGPYLPGPPAPPPDLLCQQLGTNHRMLQQSSSPPSEPILVPRGTACQPTCAFPQPLQQPCSSREMSSGHSCRGNASRRARGSTRSLSSKIPISLSQAQADTEMLERILEKPKLVVVEEPKERGMRFRYECEGRSAGSILGTSSTESNKTQPAVEIQGPIEHINKVKVTVSLVTKDFPHRPHPHCLVGKDCPDGSGICVVTFNPHSNRRHSFSNLGIQCVKRKDLDDSLQKRRSQNVDPFQTGHSKGIEDMDMNAVRLCFQCELEWDNGRKDCLSPLVSNPIYDKKATTTSQLKISCLNLYRGPCTGKTEVYMLCDKVQKDDIEIIFRRGSWKANGEFAQTDVHRQIAIVFKTPPYQDQDMTEEVEVCVVLRRLSDQMESEPVSFTYLPRNPDPYGVKRKIKSDIHFRNKSCVTAKCATEAEPLSSQPFQFPQSQSMPSPEERLCTAQPGTSTSGDICCNDLDPDFSSEDITILNQLLDMPGLWDVFPKGAINQPVASGFDQVPDTNAMFANVDVNFNHNFEPYTQDFSHYSDLQFSMLVNESQSSHSEPQDSPSHMVQVKVEDEL